MPRILRVLNRVTIGGPLLNTSYLTKYMAPEFETLLVTGSREDHETDASFITDQLGIEPAFIPEMGRSIDPRRDYQAYWKMRDLIRKFKPDVVHTHAAKPGAVGRLAARAENVPVIVHTYHGHVFHSYFNPIKTRFVINIERYLGKKSDAIIAISQNQFDELVNEFRIAPAEKFRIIPLGLDLDKFQTNYAQKRAAFRSEFNLAQDELAISIVGRLVPVKNHELFLAGLHHVLSQSGKKVRAFIVGDGETRPMLEAKARELGIAFSDGKPGSTPGSLVFTSWRSDVDVINAGSDIVALTSLNEGTPVSLIEAQAANKPIVSTRVGGIRDIVLEGETALLSDVGDAGTFSKNLLQLVEDDQLRTNLGKQGAQHVMKRFSYQRLVADMSALYHELLAKKNR